MGRIRYGYLSISNVGRGQLLLAFLMSLIFGLLITSQIIVLRYGPPPFYSPFLDARSWQHILIGTAVILALGMFYRVISLFRSYEEVDSDMGAKVLIASIFMVTLAYTAYYPVWGFDPALHFLFGVSASTYNYFAFAVAAWAVSSLVIFFVLLSVLRLLNTIRSSHARGSNRWGEGIALQANKKGIILGERNGRFLRYNGDGHLLTVAATRSGKGVSGIIPNLLEYDGSVVVTDPKGENFFVTARYRALKLGQKCVALDPFNLVTDKIQELHQKHPELRDRIIDGSFNPIDLMRADDPYLIELAKMFSEMIVPKGNTKEPFWEIEAAAVIEGFLLYLATSKEPGEEDRSLLTVRHMLCGDELEINAMLLDFKSSPYREVREAANRILQKADKERSGVFSTAHSHTHFLSSRAMEKVLSKSNFDIQDLLKGNLTLYLVLPAEQLRVFARWLRLMFSCAYWVCTRDATKRGGLEKRVLFLMEEFANLGRLEFMNSVISLGAGYGITAWMILQDLSQLKREYEKEWESFIANVDVIQAFGISDSWTAEQISKLIGETTVLGQNFNASGGQDGKFEKFKVSYSETNRPLLRPDELRRLHPDDLVLLVRPLFPILARKVRYYQHPYFKEKWDVNPLFGKSSSKTASQEHKKQQGVLEEKLGEEEFVDPFA